MIGDDVVVTVVEMRGDVARLGIAAPRHVRVHREEIYREVAETNASAAASSADADRMAALLKARGLTQKNAQKAVAEPPPQATSRPQPVGQQSAADEKPARPPVIPKPGPPRTSK